MPHDVTMPQLGMAQDAGKIVAWLKSPGDAVARGDALFEVETDKATMEVEAQAGGFLTNVTAAEGEDVAVGAVIARISDSAADEAPEPEADDLPEGVSVTMPQLGMAQDTGLLVSWQKAPGDAVSADDILFEVETDKSTMEITAGSDGFLAATLVKAGEDVPVGSAVAIISKEKPKTQIARSAAPAPATAKPAVKPPAKPAAPQPAPKAVTGRILASPKARRLALERGLDLEALARSGHPQPFHVRDLDHARTPASTPATLFRLEAETATDGLPDLVAWADQDADALLAGLAGIGIRTDDDITVTVERIGQAQNYSVPSGRALSRVTKADGNGAGLILRDLRGTPIRHADLGAQTAPVLTLMTAGAGLRITLDCTPDQLDAQAAITLITDFAGRMEQPLRCLL